jgi:serine/threonine protein kinase
VASGLEILHKEKMIHRDIKLQNIFMAADGSFKLGVIFVYAEVPLFEFCN